MRTISTSFVLSILLAAGACGGSTPPATTPASQDTTRAPAPPGADARASKVRTLAGITEYTLPNGMRFLLFPDPTQSTFTVNITYFVGSRHEGYGETGMAHLLEHMAFKGTPTHRNVLKLVQDRGGNANGTTWNDRTNYFETLSATGDNLDWALALEADRMLRCSIDPEDLKTEFSVVRNEFEMGENHPRSILEERMASSAYLWHNYGKSTIGSRADIERVPVAALKSFYAKYYQPDNALLVVAGKFDTDAAVALVEKHFGALARPGRALPATYTVEPVQDGERSVTLRRNGDMHVVGAMYHTVGGASPDYAAMSAAVNILTRKPSGRLYRALVETQLASSLSGLDYAFRDPGVATFLAEVPEPKNVAKVRDTIATVVEGLGAAKLEEAELERWRNAELKSLDLLFADSEELAVRLSEFAAMGDWRTLFAYRDQVKKITLADVTRVAQAYLRASNRTTGEFIPTKAPERAPFTETPDVAAIVRGIESADGPEPGEAFVATIESIEGRVIRKSLKGGLKAAFFPKKNRAGKVIATLRLHYGDEKNLAGKAAPENLAVAMLSRGTTKRTYQEIQDEQDRLRATIAIHGFPGGLSVDVETLREHLPATLDLVAEMLTSPSFPAKEFDVVRRETIARFEQQRSDPSSRASIELKRALMPWPKSDPRYVMTPEESVAAYKRASLGEAKAFHRDFIGATHGEFAVIGDVDPAALTAKLESAFGGFASKKPFTRLLRKNFSVPAAVQTVDIPDKEMAQIGFRADVTLRDDSPDYPAWLMLGQILGGDPSSRIWMRLREREGLSYGAGAFTSADPLDEVGSVSGYAIVAPTNADKAVASLFDELTKAASGVVTADELARARESWSKSLDTNLSSDGYVAHKLAEGLYLERTLAFTGELRQKIRAVQLADVQRVARKFLHPDQVVLIKAGDFTKKAP